MSYDIGKIASTKLSTQLLLFIDYKIHEYSPEELYENKAQLFESLMSEWQNMTEKEQEKYSKKVRLTNDSEKIKQRKNESTIEKLQDTLIQKNENISQQITHQNNQTQENFDQIISEEIIQEKQNNIQMKPFDDQNMDQSNSYDMFSEKETSQLQNHVKNQPYLNKEVIQHENQENCFAENSINKYETKESFQQYIEDIEKSNHLQRKSLELKEKTHSQKLSIEMLKPEENHEQKRAISPTKKLQLEQQKDQNYISIGKTLTLKQLKDSVKQFLKLNE